MKLVAIILLSISLVLTLMNACTKYPECQECKYDDKRGYKERACKKTDTIVQFTIITDNTSLIQDFDVSLEGKTSNQWITDFKNNPKCKE